MRNRPNISPWHTLSLLFGTALLIFIGILLNLDGLRIGSWELKYPNLEELVSSGGKQRVNMEKLLTDYHEVPRVKVDTMIDESRESQEGEEIDEIEQLEEEVELPFQDIQWDEATGFPLERCFQSLYKGDQKKRIFRVMHYGDSQIEGDRITSRLRQLLQQNFGGIGSGLQSFTPLVQSFSVQTKYSGHWKRYPGFGKKDSSITHNAYGPLIALSRYFSGYTDSLEAPGDLPEIRITPRKIAYSKARTFSTLKLYFGEINETVRIQVERADSLLAEIQLDSSSKSPYSLHFTESSTPINVQFQGGDNVDWYGYSLEGANGVVVDNIPLRGASGTFFTQITSEHMRSHFSKDEVRLILLQFGGNTVPYIDNEKRAAAYGRSIKRQINYLKKVYPKADFMLIGPADMSKKIRTEMQTHPMLEVVRDELQKAAFESGIAFWDMYRAMGGYNSMPAWVAHEPPLAAPDYVHFTPKGANMIAGWLSDAFIREYNRWKKEQIRNSEDL